MKLNVRVKQIGRKTGVLAVQELEIETLPAGATLEDLLRAVVRQQTAEYNAKNAEENLLPFLSGHQIDAQTAVGKVGFGSLYNDNKADPEKSQTAVLQSFEDGLFAVFIDETELRSLKDEMNLSETSVVIFVRLTFLAGSYW